MYNDREDTPSLSPPRHLVKTTDISGTMHYLLQSSLAINRINSILVRNYIAKGRHVIHWGKCLLIFDKRSSLS
jgi:hypothetical protein